MDSKLTDRQTEVLSFIEQFIGENKFPPTRIEIARHFNFRSANAAQDHLKALDAKGFIELVPGIARGLKVLQRPHIGQALRRWQLRA